MLQDFYMLELYFGSADSAISIEKLIEKYGSTNVVNNIKDGYIRMTSEFCNQKTGNCLCWLTEKGRTIVAQSG